MHVALSLELTPSGAGYKALWQHFSYKRIPFTSCLSALLSGCWVTSSSLLWYIFRWHGIFFSARLCQAGLTSGLSSLHSSLFLSILLQYFKRNSILLVFSFNELFVSVSWVRGIHLLENFWFKFKAKLSLQTILHT